MRTSSGFVGTTVIASMISACLSTKLAHKLGVRGAFLILWCNTACRPSVLSSANCAYMTLHRCCCNVGKVAMSEPRRS